MAETDTGFAQLAERMGVSHRFIKRWFGRLMDGTAPDLRDVSDLAVAMGCRVKIQFHQLPLPPTPRGIEAEEMSR
jgi:DNA-binding phage protein